MFWRTTLLGPTRGTAICEVCYTVAGTSGRGWHSCYRDLLSPALFLPKTLMDCWSESRQGVCALCPNNWKPELTQVCKRNKITLFGGKGTKGHIVKMDDGAMDERMQSVSSFPPSCSPAPYPSFGRPALISPFHLISFFGHNWISLLKLISVYPFPFSWLTAWPSNTALIWNDPSSMGSCVLKVMVFNLALVRGSGTYQRWGLWGGLQVIGVCS